MRKYKATVGFAFELPMHCLVMVAMSRGFSFAPSTVDFAICVWNSTEDIIIETQEQALTTFFT